jgi:hypothetical protein
VLGHGHLPQGEFTAGFVELLKAVEAVAAGLADVAELLGELGFKGHSGFAFAPCAAASLGSASLRTGT